MPLLKRRKKVEQDRVSAELEQNKPHAETDQNTPPATQSAGGVVRAGDTAQSGSTSNKTPAQSVVQSPQSVLQATTAPVTQSANQTTNQTTNSDDPEQPALPQWDTPSGESTWDDPLLQCLIILTRYWHHPHSAQSLSAGLPLVDNRLTPELFIRAAQRADLSARVLRKPFKKISPLVLPVVLLLKDREACVLTELDLENNTAQVIWPESGDGSSEIDFATLEENYTGLSIHARPAFRFDARSAETELDKPKAWFWGTLKKFWPIYGEVMLASLMINLFTLSSPLFVMNVYDRVVPNNAIETLWVLAIGAGTVYGFDFIMRTLRGYFLDMAGKKADILMASAIFQHVVDIRMSERPASTGALAKNLQEFEGLRDFFTSATLAAVIDLPFIFLFIWVLWMIGGSVAMVPAMAVPIVLITGAVLQIPLNRVIAKTFKDSSQKHAILIESLTGLETLKIIEAQGIMQRKWEQCVGRIAQSSLTSRFISSLALNFSTFVQQMSTVAVVVYGVYLIQEGVLTMGALVACTILTGRVLAPLSQVAALLVRFQQSAVSLKTLNTIMSVPVERPAEKQFLDRSELSGDIRFDDVSFNYPGMETPTLKEISLTIKPGEHVAFIGRIGSGKSTLIKLILGLYDPAEGAVLADGTDLRQIDPADLRRNIGCVPQDPTLFFGTLRDNITLGAPFTEGADVLRAAKLSGIDEFVSTHPHGFDMVIGEQGRGLSGGQVQSVSIARALLRDPPILLFDEPTSSMDSGSEERFKNRMSSYMKGKTLVMVTHKASLLSLVDRLVVLERGQIVADGPKDIILKQLSEGKLKAKQR
ncbi:MAG: type I secretion system permease/ATPase [Magnetococcales bacterium]|nr:type I secretion system permease/ATPase [Magnetococcales bacterium]